MRYAEARLAAPLDRFVECVWFLSSESAPAGAAADEGATAQRILPDGCVELICHFGDRFLAISPGDRRSIQPACFLVGLLTAPLVVQAAQRADTMGVRFRPGCAYLFFGGALTELTDRAVSLDQLWGQAGRDLWDQLAAECSQEARLDVIAHTLSTRLARGTIDRVTACAVGELVRSAGRSSIGALAARAGVTPRHLQRRFEEHVGASPKRLARILRFQNTLRWRAAQPDGRTDWVQVAVGCGYADQSHLIRDYAALAGETPASLLAAEGELSSYFTAPQRLAALFDTRRYG